MSVAPLAWPFHRSLAGQLALRDQIRRDDFLRFCRRVPLLTHLEQRSA
jgi:hypothetical protein